MNARCSLPPSLLSSYEPLLSHGIFPLHVVDDLIERTFVALAFGVLAAVLATVHLSLMPGGYGRSITITLVGKRHKGHVWVHDLAVATKVYTP